MSAGRKSRGGVSFRVIEGGGDPVARRPLPSDNGPLLMVGAVVLGWAALIGLAWTAYAVCRLTGLVKP